MTSRSRHFLLLLLGFSLFVAGCSSSSPTTGAETTTTAPSDSGAATAMSMTEIRVAALGTIDSSPLWIAESQGFFEEAGIDVRFVPVDGPGDVGTALVDGRVDAIATSATQVVKVVAAGGPIQITSYLNATSPEAARHSMTLVAGESSGLEVGCDLVGKRIAVDEVESLLAHAVTQMVVNDECDPAAIEFVQAELTDQPGLLEQGGVDAIAVFEPYTAQATRLGFAEIANLDRELCPGLSRCPIGVVAMPDAFVEADAALAEEFNRSISRALLWMESNQVEYRAELVLCCGITVDDAAEIRVVDWIGNIAALEDDLTRLMDLLESQGKLPSRPALDDLLG